MLATLTLMDSDNDQIVGEVEIDLTKFVDQSELKNVTFELADTHFINVTIKSSPI